MKLSGAIAENNFRYGKVDDVVGVWMAAVAIGRSIGCVESPISATFRDKSELGLFFRE